MCVGSKWVRRIGRGQWGEQDQRRGGYGYGTHLCLSEYCSPGLQWEIELNIHD